MLLAALVALVSAVLGVAATASAIQRWASERRGYLLAWSLTAVCLTAAVSAQTVGFAITFAPVLFRVVEVCAAVFAVCGIAWGMVEYLARHFAVVFGTRLAVTSFGVVAGTILAADPLRRPPPSGAVPDAAELYLPLPLLLLGFAHTGALLTVFGALVLAAVRTRNRDDRPVDRFVCALLAGVAALAVVAATRPGFVTFPAPVYPLLLGTGLGLTWMAVRKAVVPPARETAPLAVVGTAGRAAEADRAEGRPAGGEGVRTAEAEHASAEAVLREHPDAGPDAYGLIAIFTLVEGAGGAFDRLTERTVHEVRDKEPGTLVYSYHTVANMPQQRIFYELYRDRQAYEQHLRQPHVQAFQVERRPYVLATNVIELKLNAAAEIPRRGDR